MQYPVLMRFNQPLRDDVGIPPESRSLAAGDIVQVLSNHAGWLEERGFAERVQDYTPPPPPPQLMPDAELARFLKELETEMKPEHANKAIVPTQKKRGRPKGSKNKAKP